MNARELSRLCPTAPASLPGAPGRVPTPLDERPDMSGLVGASVWIKREDLFDDLGSGHKGRKLAYVVAEAVARSADVLITAGSLPSSQCVAVAAAAQRVGMRCQLVYCGDEQCKPARPQGSYLLALLLGPDITWHERTPWSDVGKLLDEAAGHERRSGHTPFIIPPGLSDWPGILGSIDLGLELAGQLADTPEGDRGVQVVAPAGSGTTCLGLSMASRLLGLDWTVHGMCIGGARESVANGIDRLRADTAQRLGHRSLRDAAVTLHDSSLGDGYDRPTHGEMDAMRDAMRRHQLVLDPNYLVKTFLGLRHAVDTGHIRATDRVVFVHTGGNLGIHGDSPALQRWYAEEFAPHLATP